MHMPPSIELYGHSYELSAPVNVDGTVWRVLSEPVRVTTFAKFLNTIRHVEPDSGPAYVNTVNYDTPVEYAGGRWSPRTGREDQPMVLITHRAAIEFARRHSLELIDLSLWTVLRNQELPYFAEADPYVLNIEDKHGSPVPAMRLPLSRLGIRGLFGNVSFWGKDMSGGYAACFGIGWNKSRINLQSDMVKFRWARISSVSTGIRLACKEE